MFDAKATKFLYWHDIFINFLKIFLFWLMVVNVHNLRTWRCRIDNQFCFAAVFVEPAAIIYNVVLLLVDFNILLIVNQSQDMAAIICAELHFGSDVNACEKKIRQLKFKKEFTEISPLLSELTIFERLLWSWTFEKVATFWISLTVKTLGQLLNENKIRRTFCDFTYPLKFSLHW